jgi:hypothetical protein
MSKLNDELGTYVLDIPKTSNTKTARKPNERIDRRSEDHTEATRRQEIQYVLALTSMYSGRINIGTEIHNHVDKNSLRNTILW